MGTVLYIVLRLVGMINTPMDLPIICLLISIDSMGVPALMKLIKK